MVLIEYSKTHKTHAVDATGSHLDGTLHGFTTLCGITLDHRPGHENYYEPPLFRPATLDCHKCQDAIAKAKKAGRSCEIEVREADSERITRLKAFTFETRMK